MSWGTHFCLFYETEQDLLEVLALYFTPGLANNEFCLWITPDSSNAKVTNALKQVIPSADQHLNEGNIEVLSCQQWYCENNEFDSARVIETFDTKLAQALEKGYTRMRALADEAWLDEKRWKVFSDYEGKIDERFAGKPVSIVCAYPTTSHNAADILDVARTHRFITAKRKGKWEILEAPELKRIKSESNRLDSELGTDEEELDNKDQERTAKLRQINQALQAEIIEHKRSEEALRTNEYRLQAAIDAADIVLWERDLSSGHITWLGQHEKLLGFAPGELDDNTLASFEKRVHPEDIEELRRIRQRALEERSEYSHEYRVIWRDGSIHWIRAQGRFIYNEAGQPVRLYGAVLDITERKQAEEALRQSERVLREAEALGHIGSWEQDLVTGEIFHTEENLRLFFGDDFSKGENFEDYAHVVHPDDREYVMRRRAELLEEEGPGDIEYRVVWPDGSVHVIFGRATVVRDESGRAIRVHGTNVDITERKRVEEELRLSEQRSHLLTETIPVLVWSARADGSSDYYNSAFLQYLGRTLEEMQGWSWVETLHPDDRERSSVLWTQAFRSGRNYEIEYRIKQASDGQYRWHLGRAVPLRDSLGNIVRWYGTCTDIHDQKQAEEKIRLYVTRMEALAEISHALAEVGLDYESVLNTLARRTADLIGDSCVITLFSDDKQRSFPVAFHHPNPEARAIMHDALLHTWQGGTDTERFQTLLSGESIYLPVVDPEVYRAQTEPEFWGYLDTIGISSVLIVPLKAQGRVIGTLGITRDRQSDPYTHDDLKLLQNIADRAAMSIQNAHLFRQVENAREQLGALSRRLLDVQESERRALTTELHDRVGQHLTGLSILLQNMKALLSDEAAQKLATKFDDAQALVEDSTRQIRDIMAELHLPELEDYGLAAALETYAERAASHGNLKLITDLPDLAPPPLPSGIRIALFRAAQEAISNALKHADASQLEISLQGENGRVRLKVEDNGKGFEPETVSQKEAPSWGLKIMRERIESIGGIVQIESRPGKGTQVIFEVERQS